MSDFAEKLENFPDANTIEVASRNVRQILDDASNDLRVLGNDDTGQKQRTAETQKDAHNYADAIHQMIDGVKDLIKQTEHTGGRIEQRADGFHLTRRTHGAVPGANQALSLRHRRDGSDSPHHRCRSGNSPGCRMFKEASISASGVTAMLRDTRAYYGQDINLIIVMTILIVFLILVAILRAVVAPLYLIASVVISYLSALGIGVIVFQFILGQDLTWSIPGTDVHRVGRHGCGLQPAAHFAASGGVSARHAFRCHPHGGFDRRCDHRGGCHFRRLDVRHVVRQHQHPGAGRLHHRDRASAGHLPGAHHHRARHRRAGREGQLVAIASRRRPPAQSRSAVTCSGSGSTPEAPNGTAEDSGARHRGSAAEVAPAPIQTPSRSARELAARSWPKGTTHSPTRRVRVGVRP